MGEKDIELSELKKSREMLERELESKKEIDAEKLKIAELEHQLYPPRLKFHKSKFLRPLFTKAGKKLVVETEELAKMGAEELIKEIRRRREAKEKLAKTGVK